MVHPPRRGLRDRCCPLRRNHTDDERHANVEVKFVAAAACYGGRRHRRVCP